MTTPPSIPPAGENSNQPRRVSSRAHHADDAVVNDLDAPTPAHAGGATENGTIADDTPVPAPAHADTSIGSVRADTHPHKAANDSRVSTSSKILAVLLGLTVVACAYLGYLAHRWSEFGNETHSANFQIGKELATTRAELDSAQETLKGTRSQLSTAQQRISELAKEKALVGDDRELQRIQAQDTAALAQESLAISRELGRCLEMHGEYTGYLADYISAQGDLLTLTSVDPEQQNPDDLNDARARVRSARDALSGLEDSMNEVCDAAVERHNNLVESLRE